MPAPALPSVLPSPTPTASPLVPPPAPASSGPGSFSQLLQAADARRQANPPDKTSGNGSPEPGTRTATTAARPPAPAQKPATKEGAKPDRAEGPSKTEARDTATEGTASETAPADGAGAQDTAPADAASLLAGLGLMNRPIAPADNSGVRGRGLGREALEATAAARTGKGGSATGGAAALAAADEAATAKGFAGLLAAAQGGDRGSDTAGSALLAAQQAAPTVAPEAHITDPGAFGVLAPHAATPGGAPVGHSAATPAEARLSASPGSAGFAEQLGTQLSTFVREGVQHAKLQLHPLELGPVTVNIQLDGGNAHMSFAAEHAQTRQALEQALPTLAGSLREAGLTLSGGGVFEQPPQPQNPPQGQAEGGRGDGNGASGRPGPAGADDGGLPAAPSPALRRRGVVDLVA